MDPAAFAALVEPVRPDAGPRPATDSDCAAGKLVEWLITIRGPANQFRFRRHLRHEAIQLATEAVANGQQVRTGLAQLDAEETRLL